MEANIFQTFHQASLQQLSEVNPKNTKIFKDSKGEENYTLVARPESKLVAIILDIQKKLKSIDPHHFYYPEKRLHMTIIGGISLSTSEHTLIGKLQTVLENRSLEFDCRGSGTNTSAASLSFYPKGFSLHELREQIRFKINEKGTDFTIWIPTYEYVGWINFVRYQNVPKNELLEEIRKYKEEKFGIFSFSKFDLIKTSGLVLNPEWTTIAHEF
ncbi:MAG: hypothetical protein ABI758_03535 [Candidatus Woesebacteria bacterium]